MAAVYRAGDRGCYPVVATLRRTIDTKRELFSRLVSMVEPTPDAVSEIQLEILPDSEGEIDKLLSCHSYHSIV